MKVIWASRALLDFKEARRFVARDSPVAARQLADRIAGATMSILPNQPYAGRPGRIDGTRELVIAGTLYIVVYTMESGALHIVRVIHSSRKWPETL